MKWFVVFVAIAISLTIADEQIPEKRGVLRRTTRKAWDMFAFFLTQTETNIIRNCKLNGLSEEGQNKLQETYIEMERCMSSPVIFSVSKSEYIDKMISCSRNAISKTEECLPPNRKYFPGFILDFAKSLVNFFYDDMSIMGSIDVSRCMNNFIKRDVQISFAKCVTSVAYKTHDDETIPNSMAELCGILVPEVECFPKTLGNYCSNSTNVVKFIADYTAALKHPCEIKEN